MQLNRTARRLAVAATSVAVAGTALVGATATSANAATVTSDYTCSIPGLYTGTFPLTVTGDLPVDQYWAGATVPAGLLNVTATATVPADAAGLLAAAGVDGAESRDFGFKVGSATAPVPLDGKFTTTGGTTTWNGSGKNGSFLTPKPGATNVVLPTKFNLTTKQGETDSATLNCAIASGATPATLDSITFLKQTDTKVVGKNVTVKKGKKATVKVTVNASGGAVTGGKVVATKGSKKVGTATVKNGKATLKLAKLPVGKNKITLKYGSNPSVESAKGKVTVTVKK